MLILVIKSQCLTKHFQCFHNLFSYNRVTFLANQKCSLYSFSFSREHPALLSPHHPGSLHTLVLNAHFYHSLPLYRLLCLRARGLNAVEPTLTQRDPFMFMWAAPPPKPCLGLNPVGSSSWALSVTLFKATSASGLHLHLWTYTPQGLLPRSLA